MNLNVVFNVEVWEIVFKEGIGVLWKGVGFVMVRVVVLIVL